MSCDIGRLPVLFLRAAKCSCSVIQPCRCKLKKKKQAIYFFLVWSVGWWSILPTTANERRFCRLRLQTFFSVSKDVCLFLLFLFCFFFQTYFSPFVSLPLAPSLSGAMLLEGFLLLCNEGSRRCQQCLAASPALLFYSGPVETVWSPEAKTLHSVSHRRFTADSRHSFSFYFFFFNDL